MVSLLLVLLLGVMSIGTPVAFAIMLVSFFYFIHSSDLPSVIFVQRVAAGLDSFPLLAVPFFVLTGTAMSRGGLAARLFGLADSLVGHMRGGLGQVNVLQSLFIGGMCGSSNADAAIDSKTIVPIMVQHNYGKGFSSAVTAASSIITTIIPPGLALVIYGLQADTSIGRLFIGGIIPGFIMAASLMFVVSIVSRRRGYGSTRQSRMPWKEVLRYARRSFWALLMPVLLIGGLRMGVFTPTELGAIAALYALFVGVVIYKEIKISEIPSVLVEASLSTAVIMLILASASALSYVITWEDIPQTVIKSLLGVSQNPYVILMVVNIALLVMGTMFEATSMLVILTPILAPMMQQLGVDLVQFGIVLVINLCVGAITPPVGTVLYTVCSITGSTVSDFTRNLIPFLIALLVVIALVTYIPGIVLFLPNLIMGP
jgi:tripartite ATP-independent transporter DctM subunit